MPFTELQLISEDLQLHVVEARISLYFLNVIYLYLFTFQQRFMIAAIKDLAGPSEEQVASYLEACNLIFEEGLLSQRRINNLQSPVLANIRRGMEFFEGWCNTHSQTGMTIKYLRQRKEKLCNNITK